MAVNPVARYMILCDDFEVDAADSRRINIYGLLSTVLTQQEGHFPYLLPQFSVLLTLTGGRGRGTGQIACVLEETGQQIFMTPNRPIKFPNDPLQVVGLGFRLENCLFPRAGTYLVQF